MNSSNRCLQTACLLGFAYCAITTATASAAILISDDFESYFTLETAWLGSGPDYDPTTTPQGHAWTIEEFSAVRANVVAHPQNFPAAPTTNASFAAASPDQYLHFIRTNSGGQPRAWIDLSAANQALIAANGNVSISAKIFAFSGYDLWRGAISISAFDSAATVGSNLAFDVNALDGGSLVDGFIHTSTNRTTSTATAIPSQINVWQNLKIDIDFIADSYTITLDSETPLTLALPSNLTKISSLLFAPGDITLTDNWRGGIDDLLVTTTPEPSTFVLVLAAAMAFGRCRRRRN